MRVTRSEEHTTELQSPQFPDYRQADADYAAKDVTERIDNASEKKYDALLESHLEDYQELFARVELDLGGTYNADEETDQLLSAWNSNSSKGTQNQIGRASCRERV